MTFLDAVRGDSFVRRAGWPRWRCVDESGVTGGPISRSDFLADDWENPPVGERPTRDESEIRFSLMELE